MYTYWLEYFVEEHGGKLATHDCLFCNGSGWETDYEGWPVSFPVPESEQVCGCIHQRIAYVEYFERGEGTQDDYDKKPDSWEGEWIPF